MLTVHSYRSKREVYNFLTVDVGYYLPAYEQVSIYFLKDVVAAKKRCEYHQVYQSNSSYL